MLRLPDASSLLQGFARADLVCSLGPHILLHIIMFGGGGLGENFSSHVVYLQ